MGDGSRPWRIEIPAGSMRIEAGMPGFTAAAPELTDDEVDALWRPRPVQATRPVTDAEMHRAIFGSTSADTPEDARALGWPL